LTTDYTDATDIDPGFIRGIRVIRGQKLLRMIHEHLSEDIIGAAMKVLNTLRPGLDEKLYENALRIELHKRGHRVEQQRAFTVFYENELIGTLIPDLIIDELVIVDPKVVTGFNDTHLAQMSGYLAITNLKLALLLNFKSAKLEWKRIVR
jgi:GxxExxY protein